MNELNSVYGIEKYNVLFITLDCCRYDTAAVANLPFLKSLGAFEKAYTHGTYTLPSHTSFFMGYLPVAVDSKENYYNPDIRHLWRMKSGRSKKIEKTGLLLDGSNILEGYRKMGFFSLGVGGVRWFRGKFLQDFFDEFLFFGPDDEKNVFRERKKEELALNNLDKIVDTLKEDKKYFLFINSLETHVPYDFGEGIYSDAVKSILNKAEPIWGCKKINLEKIDISKEELSLLHTAQISALESVDSKIEELVKRLPKPLCLVVTADHGECFGEDMLWGHGFPHKKVMEVPLLIKFMDS